MGNKCAAVEERRCRTVYIERIADLARIEVKSYPEKGILYINMQAKTWFFNSHERFKSESELNMSINIGLKETGKDIGV